MIERDEKGDTILGGRVDSFLYGIVEWADISFEVNEKNKNNDQKWRKNQIDDYKNRIDRKQNGRKGVIEIYTCFDQRKKWKWMKWKESNETVESGELQKFPFYQFHIHEKSKKDHIM